MTKEEMLKLSFGELVDMGVCPNCFNKEMNGAYFGDESKLFLFEDADIHCQFVQNPRAVGHMMISTQTHYHDLSEAPDYINEKIIRFAKQFIIILKEVFKCERVYLCTMSDGPMNHYHIQLIPRYSNEKRGSTNFVKPRKEYIYLEKETFEIRSKINEYSQKQNTACR